MYNVLAAHLPRPQCRRSYFSTRIRYSYLRYTKAPRNLQKKSEEALVCTLRALQDRGG